MKIDVLICSPDGTQSLVQREVPESYLNAPEVSPETAQTGQ